VNKKPPELPNIEDATLRACLAPLMDAMNAGPEMASPTPLPAPDERMKRPGRVPSGSNDNPPPASDAIGTSGPEQPGVTGTLAEWRAGADDDFGAFRMIELFLGMTDSELLNVAADFPKQIGGTIARIARIKRRLAVRYDTVTIALALLERAMARAAAGPGSVGSPTPPSAGLP
jgi:hypothetical protein